MKNLKKLVIVFAVLALLVSAAVITVFSADTSAQELERAELYYERAVSQKTLTNKSAKLEELYTFVSTSSLTDGVNGFKEFKEKYMALSVEIGAEYLNGLGDNANNNITAINKVFSHFKKCPVDDNVAAYEEYLAIVATAYDANEEVVRDVLALAMSASGSERVDLLVKIYNQCIAVSLDTERWDYSIYFTIYNTLLVDYAEKLANDTANVLNGVNANADKVYKENVAKIVLGDVEDLDAKLSALTDAYNAAFDAVVESYGERDLTAAAEAAYAEAYEAEFARLIVLYASGADVAYDLAYNETYVAEKGKGTDEAAAVTAAHRAGKAAYNNAINATTAVGSATNAKPTESAYINAVLADMAAKAVNDGVCETVDEAVAEVIAYVDFFAKVAAEDASSAVYSEDSAIIMAEALAAADKAYEDLLYAGVADKEAAKAEAESKAARPDIYVDSANKTALGDAISAYNVFVGKGYFVESLGSIQSTLTTIDSLLESVSLDNAKFLFAEYDIIVANPDEYKYPLNAKGNAIYSAFNFLSKSGLNASTPGYSEFYAKVNAAKIQYDKDLLAAKDALDKQGDLSQHDWNTKTYHDYIKDFDDGKIINAYNPTSTSKSIYGEETLPNGKKNGYLIMNYGETSTHLYFEPSFANNAYGIVGDFDIMISEDFQEFRFQAMLKGVLCTAEIFQIVKTTDGNFGIKRLVDDKNTFVTVDKLFTPNVWSHISFTFDPNTFSGSLYVNYEYIGDICYHDHDYQGGTYVTMQRMRVGVTKTNQWFAIDNLHFFSGTTYRDYYKFDNMSNADKFKYYVEYFENDAYSAFNRNTAYVKAKTLYSEFVGQPAYDEYTKYYTDPALANFYEENIKRPAIEANLVTIKEKIANIQNSEISSATTATITSAIKDVRSFISSNVDFIDRTSKDYLDEMKKIDDVEARIVRLEQVKNFTDAVTRFARATTLNSMNKHYEAAKEYYNIAGYGKAPAEGELSNIDHVIDDPIVTDFVATHGMTPFDYYLSVPADTMYARERIENSKKIIGALSFIKNMEGYEATEEFWNANYEYINEFVVIIRKIVTGGNYETNPDDGLGFTAAQINAALAEFESIDKHFFDLLQNEYIEVLETQLTNFAASSTYIEKVGICSYVEEYLKDNEETMNLENAKIQELIYTFQVYRSELDLQREDYASLLAENTQYFIATVKQMQSVITYAELKPLYDQAASYYYGMNTDSDEAQAAMIVYDAYGEKLAYIEENSTFFIEYVKTFKLAEKLGGKAGQDAIYEALVNCMLCVDGIDMTFSGISSAYSTYTETLEKYNSGAYALNAVVDATANVTCAVRSGSIASAILAVIKNIFGR